MKSKNEFPTVDRRDRILDRNALFMASISAIRNNPKVLEKNNLSITFFKKLYCESLFVYLKMTII